MKQSNEPAIIQCSFGVSRHLFPAIEGAKSQKGMAVRDGGYLPGTVTVGMSSGIV